MEARSAREGSFPFRLGIPKPERGHLVLPEKGNPPKGMVGEELVGLAPLDRAGRGRQERAPERRITPGKSEVLAASAGAGGHRLHLLRPMDPGPTSPEQLTSASARPDFRNPLRGQRACASASPFCCYFSSSPGSIGGGMFKPSLKVAESGITRGVDSEAPARGTHVCAHPAGDPPRTAAVETSLK